MTTINKTALNGPVQREFSYSIKDSCKTLKNIKTFGHTLVLYLRDHQNMGVNDEHFKITTFLKSSHSSLILLFATLFYEKGFIL